MNLFALWGKTVKNEEAESTITHPLICHMIDVAEVTGALWETCLHKGTQDYVSDMLNLDKPDCRSLVQFWAALHDLGKASPAFQRQYGTAVFDLAAEGLDFQTVVGHEPCYHGTISAWALPRMLKADGVSTPMARAVAQAVGGHHGSWPAAKTLASLSIRQRGGSAWQAARQELYDLLHQAYPISSPYPMISCRSQRHAFAAWFSGLVSTADWIGSMIEHFGPSPKTSDVVTYAEQASAQARAAIEALHWGDWHPPHGPALFEDLFPWPPRKMQAQVIDLADQLPGPALVIIEAPTGSGKTEAAFYLADHWAHICQQRGTYVAMPTMATSNQMYERMGKVLAKRYPDHSAHPLLVHSQARWQAPPATIEMQTDDADQDGADAMAWFLPRRRSLLAPFGVGTVDQALLSVLQTRHFFVRLFGLAQKTVIFDEVHAYDTYMSTLFERLLRWLRQMNVSPVLLSATLPDETRHRLLQAYAGDDTHIEPRAQTEGDYPAISWSDGENVGTIALPPPADRSIHLEWLDRRPESLVEALRGELIDGGCVAVICNTVARAQTLYQALQEAHLVPSQDLILFHARFPFGERQQIEREVLACFSKQVDEHDMRPRRAIVVATQVIEQSLDLDFDLMVTDLAPVDLVLQRVGRLHRHERVRPDHLDEPRLLIACERDPSGVPALGNDRYIYEPYVLLRSFVTIWDHDTLHLPSQTRALIESVYGPEQAMASDIAMKSIRDAIAGVFPTRVGMDRN